MNKYIDSQYPDQDAINFLIKDHLEYVRPMSKHWNGCMSVVYPLYSVHYAGLRKNEWTVEKHNERIQEKKERILEMTLEEIEQSHSKEYTERLVQTNKLF